MLVRLLSQPHKIHLIRCAELLAISDDPLLWGGKEKEDITSKTDISKLSFKKSQMEVLLISELKKEGQEINDYGYDGWIEELDRILDPVEYMLIEKLKTFSLHRVENPEVRVEAALAVLKEIFNEEKVEDISALKLMLFELMLLALRDGTISNIEWALLKEFQNHYQLEDFIFDDLLERAETLNQDVSKILSIILE